MSYKKESVNMKAVKTCIKHDDSTGLETMIDRDPTILNDVFYEKRVVKTLFSYTIECNAIHCFEFFLVKQVDVNAESGIAIGTALKMIFHPKGHQNDFFLETLMSISVTKIHLGLNYMKRAKVMNDNVILLQRLLDHPGLDTTSVEAQETFMNYINESIFAKNMDDIVNLFVQKNITFFKDKILRGMCQYAVYWATNSCFIFTEK